MKTFGSPSLRFQISLSCLGSRNPLSSFIGSTDETCPQITLWELRKGQNIFHFVKSYNTEIE